MNDSTELEKRLVSACMVGGAADVARAVGLGVSSSAFSDCQIAEVWAGLVAAATEDRKTGSFFVARRTFGKKIPEAGMALISEIEKLEPTSLYVRQLAEAVVGESKRRAVVLRLKAALASVALGKDEWSESWAKASAAIRDAQIAAAANAVTADLEALCDAYIAEETSGKPPGTIGTGVPGFDEFLGLLAPGEVLVMAGRPGVGKTALALQMADAAVRAGKRAVVFSLEMAGKDLIGRLAKQRAGRRASVVKGCTKAEYQAAKEARIGAAQAIKGEKGRLWVYEVQEASSVAQIEDRVAMLASADLTPDVVVIDYLQLVAPEDSRAPREQQVALISRRVKLMALTYKVPVILLSQLNRDAEKNDRTPKMSDLRESGSIEQDADRVWLIYPHDGSAPVSDSPTVTVVIEQAKNRNGESGIGQKACFYKPAFIFERQ